MVKLWVPGEACHQGFVAEPISNVRPSLMLGSRKPLAKSREAEANRPGTEWDCSWFFWFFPSFPTRSVWKSCILPDMQSICRAKCRANSEQIPAVEVVMVMCFEDALSDDNMMKLDWNYLGWALGLFLTRDVWKFMTASPWWPAAMFPTSFAGSSLNCAERASVKILKFQFQQIQKPPSSSFLIKSSQVRSWGKKSFLPTLRCRSLQLHEIARFEMFWACLNSWHCFRIEQFLQTP